MRTLTAAALAALLAPLPAAAQNWHRVYDGEVGTQYVDLATLKPDGDTLSASEFMVLRTPMQGYRYVATVIKYDCKGRRVGLLSMEAFKSKDNGTGPIPDSVQPLEAVLPGSPGAAALDFVCNVDRSRAVKVADPWTDKP